MHVLSAKRDNDLNKQGKCYVGISVGISVGSAVGESVGVSKGGAADLVVL